MFLRYSRSSKAVSWAVIVILALKTFPVLVSYDLVRYSDALRTERCKHEGDDSELGRLSLRNSGLVGKTLVQLFSNRVVTTLPLG
jgi:hypothetical protein